MRVVVLAKVPSTIGPHGTHSTVTDMWETDYPLDNANERRVTGNMEDGHIISLVPIIEE